MTVDADGFAAIVIEAAGRIAEKSEFMYGWEADEVNSVATLAAYERQEFLRIAADESPATVERVLWFAVTTHFRQERSRALRETDEYFYDPEYVRLFLPYFFARDDWMNGPINEDTIAEFPTTEALDTAIDIRDSWHRLKDWQETVIVARHLLFPPTTAGGVDWDGVASSTGRKTDGAARTAYAEATRQLTLEMNVCRAKRAADHEGTGARKAISNARASALISMG